MTRWTKKTTKGEWRISCKMTTSRARMVMHTPPSRQAFALFSSGQGESPQNPTVSWAIPLTKLMRKAMVSVLAISGMRLIIRTRPTIERQSKTRVIVERIMSNMPDTFNSLLLGVFITSPPFNNGLPLLYNKRTIKGNYYIFCR